MGVANVEADALAGPGFFLDRSALRALGIARRESYRAAAPFPHVVVDDFLGSPLATSLASVFPSPAHPRWLRRDYDEQSARLGHLQRAGFEGVHGSLRHLLAELSGMAFLDFLEKLTGIEGLIPDPHFHGAGLHLTLPGGHLALHADFNRDRVRSLSRRLTALYYLNPDWQPEWGGELELWDPALTECVVRIPPLLDRLVVMAHGDSYWHGHPQPLRCPEGKGRAAVAAYFYTAEISGDSPKPHGAIWAPRR